MKDVSNLKVHLDLQWRCIKKQIKFSGQKKYCQDGAYPNSSSYLAHHDIANNNMGQITDT